MANSPFISIFCVFLAIYLGYLSYLYAFPFISLNWALLNERVETKMLVVKEGERLVLGFDYYSDHADWQSAHYAFCKDGVLYAEQWTAPYGSAADNNNGLYINGLKLRKDQVLKIADGAKIYQLDPYGRGAKVKRFVLLTAATVSQIEYAA